MTCREHNSCFYKEKLENSTHSGKHAPYVTLLPSGPSLNERKYILGYTYTCAFFSLWRLHSFSLPPYWGCWTKVSTKTGRQLVSKLCGLLHPFPPRNVTWLPCPALFKATASLRGRDSFPVLFEALAGSLPWHHSPSNNTTLSNFAETRTVSLDHGAALL